MTPALDWSHRRPPPIPKPPKTGDIVTPDQHPRGYPRWRVTTIALAAVPNDIADLVPVDPNCPVRALRRRVGSLRVAPAEQPRRNT